MVPREDRFRRREGQHECRVLGLARRMDLDLTEEDEFEPFDFVAHARSCRPRDLADAVGELTELS